LRDIPTLQCERIVPPIANHVPHLILSWDEKRVKMTRQRLTRELAKGDPPILLGRVSGTGDKGLLISVFMLQQGEERIVADRLHTLLAKASRLSGTPQDVRRKA
jgi:L-seryl-tRNA(Ser) seleniumtransferase